LIEKFRMKYSKASLVAISLWVKCYNKVKSNKFGQPMIKIF